MGFAVKDTKVQRQEHDDQADERDIRPDLQIGGIGCCGGSEQQNFIHEVITSWSRTWLKGGKRAAHHRSRMLVAPVSTIRHTRIGGRLLPNGKHRRILAAA